MPDVLDRYLEAAEHLQPSPAALEILQLLSDDSRNRARIVALARTDPPTVAAILRAASSAALSRGGAPASLDRAVAVLGEDELFQIVVHQALSGLQVKEVSAYGLEEFAFWTHSLTTAHAAEALARLVGLDPGMMYVVGLLLNLGKIPLGTHAEVPSWEVGQAPEEIERTHWGLDHAELGAAMASRWGLAEPIPICIRFHHRPSDAPEDHRPAVDIAHVATYAADWLGQPLGLDAMRHPLDEDAMARLSIGDAQLSSLAVAVSRGMAAAEAELAQPQGAQET